MAKTKVDKSKINRIRNGLNADAQELHDATLAPAGPNDFGGSGLGMTLGDDADRARHHVLETAHKMGGGVGGFSDALKRAVDIADGTDAQAQDDVNRIDSSVSTIGIQFADPSNRRRPAHQHGDGRTP